VCSWLLEKYLKNKKKEKSMKKRKEQEHIGEEPLFS
jgi:hypothetical protein